MISWLGFIRYEGGCAGGTGTLDELVLDRSSLTVGSERCCEIDEVGEGVVGKGAGFWGMGLPCVSEILSTSAANHRHILIVFQHHLILIVQIEHRNGIQLCGHTARLRRQITVDWIDQRLDDGMIGGIEMIGKWKLTLAMTIEGIVAGWCNDPIAPAHITKIDVERPSLTNLTAISSFVSPSAGRPPRTICQNFPNRSLLVAPIVCVGHQQWLLVRPLCAILLVGNTPPEAYVFVRSWLVLFARHDINENAIVLFRRSQPSLHCWHHIETDGRCAIDLYRFCIDQQEYWVRLAFDTRPDNVVHQDFVPDLWTICDWLAVQC